MNLTQKLLESGFVETVSESLKTKFNPVNNWMGVSTYHPDARFIKGDIKVILSLQGVLSPPKEGIQELWDNMAVKYIEISRSGTIVFQTWTGELPDDKLWQ